MDTKIKATKKQARKVLATGDVGLCLGIGKPIPGQMCERCKQTEDLEGCDYCGCLVCYLHCEEVEDAGEDYVCCLECLENVGADRNDDACDAFHDAIGF